MFERRDKITLQKHCKHGAAPEPEIAERAEAYARLAVRLVAERGLRSSEAEFRSTLGEVLLTRGHAADAVEQLETARRLSARHAVFNEIRWDLALAYLCSNTGDPNEILREIRDIESSREVRPFTEDLDLLERAKDANVCGRPPEE